jgi:Chaperone of endosialidase
MFFNTTGSYNVAIGDNALGDNSTGGSNTAIGSAALNFNRTGSYNIAIGNGAGQSIANGNSNNIVIGSLGASADDGTIRIGTVGTHTSFFAAGIYGVSSGSDSAIPLLVDSTGQLVTVSSSLRYKQDIQDMGDASNGLMHLRPVTFRYKKALADGSQPIQYG